MITTRTEAVERTAALAIDCPSTVFAGLDNDDIADTGHRLDEKVAGLLNAIGVDRRHAQTAR